MSYVTNVILNVGLQGKSKIDEVNKFFEDTERNVGFVYVDDKEKVPNGWYGGTKYLEVDIAIGAFNYLDLEGLKIHMHEMEWESPEDVQLLICDQEENRFSIWNLIK